MNNFDGYLYLSDKKHRHYYDRKDMASQFTEKQAGKIALDLNKEAQRNYSYYYRYGFYDIESCA